LPVRYRKPKLMKPCRSTTPTTIGIQPTTAITSHRDTDIVTVTMIGVVAPTTATIRIGTKPRAFSGGIE